MSVPTQGSISVALLVVSLAHPSLHFYGTLQIRMLCMLIQQHTKLEVSTSDANLTKCGPQSGQMLTNSVQIIVVHMKLLFHDINSYLACSQNAVYNFFCNLNEL